MPDSEPPDETPPGTTSPSEPEDQPAWMTPEGRLREIPIKDLSAGERYTRDELRRLREYWTEERTEAVAEWFRDGTPEQEAPRCIAACELERRHVAPVRRLDLRCINLRWRFTPPASPGRPRALASVLHLEHADLRLARMDKAFLGDAHLEYVDLFGASLQNALLFDADLTHASLLGAHLEDAELYGANLRHAHLDFAYIENANLCRVRLESTSFADVHWRSNEGKLPDEMCFRAFDVRGIRNSDPLFDRWVRQSNFIWKCRETWWNPWRHLGEFLQPEDKETDTTADAPEQEEGEEEPGTVRARLAAEIRNWPPPLWLLWKVTCDCGRSFVRWAVWCLGVAIVFGFIFWLGGVVEVPGPSEAARQPNALTYFYFSIVTFTTLGFGDVTPTGNAGEIWVMLEVILGYIGLGGLISIFTTKLIPPR